MVKQRSACMHRLHAKPGVAGWQALSPFAGHRHQANDLNWIPLAAVDRIEILTDSASAIYGSDAIGGVINVILRKDYDGLEVGTSLSRLLVTARMWILAWLLLEAALRRGRFLFSADFFTRPPLHRDTATIPQATQATTPVPVDYPTRLFAADWYDFRNTDNISVNGNTSLGALLQVAFQLR